MFDDILKSLQAHGVEGGQMFGARCMKINRKAFAMEFEGDMVFKLSGAEHAAALKLPGSHLFEPMTGHAMKERVQVPAAQSQQWPGLAEAALAYLTKLTQAS